MAKDFGSSSRASHYVFLLVERSTVLGINTVKNSKTKENKYVTSHPTKVYLEDLYFRTLT